MFCCYEAERADYTVFAPGGRGGERVRGERGGTGEEGSQKERVVKEEGEIKGNDKTDPKRRRKRRRKKEKEQGRRELKGN